MISRLRNDSRENCTTITRFALQSKCKLAKNTRNYWKNNLNDSPRLVNLLACPPRGRTGDPWSSFVDLWIPSWLFNKAGLDLTLALIKWVLGKADLLLASKPGLELIDLVSLTGGVFEVELEPPTVTLLVFNWCCCSSPLLGVLAATDLLIFHT